MTGSAIKIALNGSIGLEVTPPEEVSSAGGVMSSNASGVLSAPLQPLPPSPPQQQQSQPPPPPPQSSTPLASPHSSQEHLQGTIV